VCISVVIIAASCIAPVLYLTSTKYQEPAERIWIGYKTLFVSEDFPEQTVLDICGKAGITDVIALSEQKPPDASQFLSVNNAIADYETKRVNFFYDKTAAFKLYYIEDVYSEKLSAVQKTLTALGAENGVNVPEARSWFTGIICGVVFVFFVVVSKHRLVMLLGGLFPVVYSFCISRYPAGAVTCLFLYSIFLLQKVWLKKKFIGVWLKKIPNITVLVIALGVIAVYSRVYALLFLLTVSASTSALYLLCYLTNYYDKKRIFLPVRIRPAQTITMLTKKSLLSIFLPAIAIIAFVVLLLAGGNAIMGSFFANQKKLLLPAPSLYAASDGFSTDAYTQFVSSVNAKQKNGLPSLAEFINLTWETLAFPYRTLHTSPPNEKVVIHEYRQTSTGFIESFTTEYVFDESFISSIIAEIYESEPPALERILVKQEKFTMVDYMGGGMRQEPLTMFLLLISGLVPLMVMGVFLKWNIMDDWSSR
jgi:hypothetical protein